MDDKEARKDLRSPYGCSQHGYRVPTGLMKNIASSAIVFPKWQDLASKDLLDEILCQPTGESAGSSL